MIPVSYTHLTGTSDELPIKEQLEMIREMLPDAEKIGILYTCLLYTSSESLITVPKRLAQNIISASSERGSSTTWVMCP